MKNLNLTIALKKKTIFFLFAAQWQIDIFTVNFSVVTDEKLADIRDERRGLHAARLI